MPFAVLGRAPRSVAILGNGAGTTGARLGHSSRHGDRRRGDRPRADRARAPLVRPARPAAACGSSTTTRGPSCAAPDRRYDAIFVDAYRQPYIPFYLTTREFFDLVRERLTPGGAVIVNAGHPRGSRTSSRCSPPACARRSRTSAAYDITEVSTLLVAGDAGRGVAHPPPRRQSPRRAAAAFAETAAGLAPAAGRRRAYTGRPRAGRVAHRPLDRQLRRRRLGRRARAGAPRPGSARRLHPLGHGATGQRPRLSSHRQWARAPSS